MRLFESDNIWKRRKRAQARASAPDVVTVGFLIVLAAYALLSIRPAVEAYRRWKSLL